MNSELGHSSNTGRTSRGRGSWVVGVEGVLEQPQTKDNDNIESFPSNINYLGAVFFIYFK